MATGEKKADGESADKRDEWLFAALMAERLTSDEELIPMEEVEKRLDAKKKSP